MNNAWLAGFFDGEGCVYISKNGKSIQISITQKNTNCLFLIKQKFGGSVSHKGSGCSVWRTSDKRTVLKFLRAIRPYSIEKSADIEIGIAFAKTISNKSQGHQTVSNEYLKRRQNLRILIGDGKRHMIQKAS